MMSDYRNGKIAVEVIRDVYQSDLKEGDLGYIDGYVRGGDGPCAVFVRNDGYIDLCPTYCIRARGYYDYSV